MQKYVHLKDYENFLLYYHDAVSKTAVTQKDKDSIAGIARVTSMEYYRVMYLKQYNEKLIEIHEELADLFFTYYYLLSLKPSDRLLN